MEIFSEVIEDLNEKVRELENLQERLNDDLQDAAREIRELKNEKQNDLVNLIEAVITDNNIDLKDHYLDINDSVDEALDEAVQYGG